MLISYAFGTLEVKMSCYKIQPAKTLPNIYFDILEYLSTLDFLSFYKSDL